MAVDSVPVIDIAPLRSEDRATARKTADALCAAASDVGFFYIANHGIARRQIDEVFSLARQFFHASSEQKRDVTVSANHRGWLEIGAARMYGSKQPDLKESFIWGLDIDENDADYRAGDRLLAPNRWPDFLPGMRESLVQYFHAAQDCGESLLRAFASGLGIPQDYFVRSFDKPISRGSLIWYPPVRATEGVTALGSDTHTDYGMLTLLCQDDVGGLQVKRRNGNWLDVSPIDGTLVVNIGDLLARWSNGRFESTPHRVIRSDDRERYSIAMFVDPNWDAVLEPATIAGEQARYEPVLCADYIAARFNEAFAYRNSDCVDHAGKT
jgi:isopenicillin N synthase-like dioxygenase